MINIKKLMFRNFIKKYNLVIQYIIHTYFQLMGRFKYLIFYRIRKILSNEIWTTDDTNIQDIQMN